MLRSEEKIEQKVRMEKKRFENKIAKAKEKPINYDKHIRLIEDGKQAVLG